MNNKAKLTLTTPYLDAHGAGLLVDIVHSLYEGKSSGKHDANDKVVAVLGASFDIFKFHRYMPQYFTKFEFWQLERFSKMLCTSENILYNNYSEICNLRI